MPFLTHKIFLMNKNMFVCFGVAAVFAYSGSLFAGAQEDFMKAVEAGDAKTVKTMIKAKSVDIEKLTDGGSRPIELATNFGKWSVVEVLVDEGAELDIGSPGSYIMSVVANKEAPFSVIKKMVERGVNLNRSAHFFDGPKNTLIVDAEARPDKKKLLQLFRKHQIREKE